MDIQRITAGQKILGQAAEEFAKSIYQKAGFEILAQNYRFGAYEVDLIARRGYVVHMVEVKYRRSLQEANFALFNQQLKRIAIAGEEFMRERTEWMQIDAFLVDHKLQWERIENIMIANE